MTGVQTCALPICCLICRPSGTSKLCCAYHHIEHVFHIYENNIEIVDKWPHLGHIITDCVDDNEDILSRKISLIGQINSILGNFRNVDCLTKTRLVKAYCTSFYGAEIWDLSHNSIDSICTAWRKGIRRIWKVPNTTHSVLIPSLCDSIPLIDLFYKRTLKFIYACLISSSS